MAAIDFPYPSKIIALEDLAIPRAQEVASAIQSGHLSYVKLVECRVLEKEGFECVIFDVEVELGQKNNVYSIEKHERIAVVFDIKDDYFPEVLSLRDNFPKTPHTNLHEEDYPISLCLYDQLFSEVKLYLTPTRFIERIREWLADTAKGRLHGEDQPLEPLFLEYNKQLIIPFDLFKSFNADNPPILEVRVTEVNNIFTFIAEPSGLKEREKKVDFVATVLQCPPQVHGVIHKKPKNLLQLHEFTARIGFDLLQSLRGILSKWQSEGKLKELQNYHFMLIIAFPKTRGKDSKIESTDVWGFLFEATVKKVGIDIGVWEERPGMSLGMLLPIDLTKQGDNLSLDMCRTMFSFSREMGAEQNGLPSPADTKIAMIGVGALGSQVFLNLVRAGFGEWTLIDNDIFLPHNLARHALDSRAIGFSKAECLAWTANMLIEGVPIARHIVKDILKSKDYSEDMKKALAEAAVILDCAASSAATRFIARDTPSPSRRLSLFLSPSGNDSVLLAEDSKREMSLDLVEMQYYRLLINEKDLEDFLSFSGKHLRYGNSCSDINSSLPQELVSLHSAICSRAFRNALSDNSAKIVLWRVNPADFSIRSHVFFPSKTTEIKTTEWMIYVDDWVMTKIFEARASKLTNETGGVLVGSFDMQRKIVYIVDTLLSPPDSQEWPAVYIRGCQGLAQKMKEIGDITLGKLEYVGEWHSHTVDSSCLPSGDDKIAFAWLADMRKPDGLPAMMLIAGNNNKFALYLGYMS